MHTLQSTSTNAPPQVRVALRLCSCLRTLRPRATREAPRALSWKVHWPRSAKHLRNLSNVTMPFDRIFCMLSNRKTTSSPTECISWKDVLSRYACVVDRLRCAVHMKDVRIHATVACVVRGVLFSCRCGWLGVWVVDGEFVTATRDGPARH